MKEILCDNGIAMVVVVGSRLGFVMAKGLKWVSRWKGNQRSGFHKVASS